MTLEDRLQLQVLLEEHMKDLMDLGGVKSIIHVEAANMTYALNSAILDNLRNR